MKNQFTVFYSWQSDIQKNRNFIGDCIKKSIKELRKRNLKEIDLDINLDRDTKNNTGSPDISNTILKKISHSDIFVCDVTIINNSSDNSDKRLTPNPNVLFELGYAAHHLGWDRIICINNLEYGKNEQLPFDIKGHSITSFNSSDKDKKSKLTNVLTYKISSIILNYDDIIKKYNAGKISSHDKEMFLEINKKYTETTLYDSISSAVDSLFSNGYYYSKWGNLIQTYNKTLNHFLDSEIHNSYKLFLESLDNFRMLCYTNFDFKKSGRSLLEYEESGIEITEDIKYDVLINEHYSARKATFPNETWEQADKRNQKLQKELFDKGQLVKKHYKEFVTVFKKKQLE